MCCKGILKRFLPFFITLTAGLFIASFFVDLTPTPFKFGDRGMRRFRDYQEMKMENMELRQRLADTQQQLDQLRRDPKPNFDVPPPPPPKAPRAIR